jgi:ElaB/YqjD/DUF883 family membrane-anchored ribosome-binding protein
MMSENGHKEVDELANEAREELRELGREARKKAEEAKQEVVGKLYEAAQNIRKEARENQAGTEGVKAADGIASGLEKTAHFLNRSDDAADEVKRAVKRNPWQALLLVFAVGLAIGLVLRLANGKK